MTGPYEDAAALRCGNLHERMKFLIALLDQNLDRVPQNVRHAALELEAEVRKHAPLEVDPAETADAAALDRMLVQWDGLKALLRQDAGRLIARTPPISMTRLIQRELEEFCRSPAPTVRGEFDERRAQCAALRKKWRIAVMDNQV
jgi:hypothetical protein